VIVAAIGYNFGAKLTKIMVSADVISWALVLALPFHFGLAIYYFPKLKLILFHGLDFYTLQYFSQWIGFLCLV
jgi:hypothetical protein